ncbi:MAG TPA: cupin domain-containing protein [Bacteroidales bacterium]|nr:cupin domain-containing protein [Bacteroidales bacterium]HPS62856.1 cupin domain-containing protein [Bacteroidales bacterium]
MATRKSGIEITTRATELIELLKLRAHPEGGYYREIFRSSRTVVRDADGKRRTALTSIYFLLTKGNASAWHRVEADETWHFYEGAPLELECSGPPGAHIHLLGPVSEQMVPVTVIPAGCWQRARTQGEYTLVGCTVGPGFEFDDFTLEDPPEISPGILPGRV